MFAVRATPVTSALVGGPKFAIPGQKTTPAGIYVSGGTNISQGNVYNPVNYFWGVNDLNSKNPPPL